MEKTREMMRMMITKQAPRCVFGVKSIWAILAAGSQRIAKQLDAIRPSKDKSTEIIAGLQTI